MTKLSFDRLVSLIAPHGCISCGVEGSVLCDNCIFEYCDMPMPHCAGCRKQQMDFKVCRSCRSWLELKYVYVSTAYDGIGSELVKTMKFKYQRQATTPIAKIMSEAIGAIDTSTVLCPIPTAHARIRERGFDHAKIIAQDLASILNMKVAVTLDRKSNTRQLGSSRKARFTQMESEFEAINVAKILGKDVLLVDDVMTTGATLTAAARVLRNAGASSVSAVIFTQKI